MMRTKAICFAVGLVVWVICFGIPIAVLSGKSGSSELTVVEFLVMLLMMIPIFQAIRGWDAGPRIEDNPYGWQLKVFLVIIVAGTFVGLVPAIYWTGRGTLMTLGQNPDLI